MLFIDILNLVFLLLYRTRTSKVGYLKIHDFGKCKKMFAFGSNSFYLRN
jgi:hypothetical protein